MKVYLYLRNTEDWDNLKDIEDATFWVKGRHGNVRHWNHWCSLSWFEYRQRLKEICFGAIESLEIPLLYFGMKGSQQAISVMEDDDFVVPTDDDDFFHPDIEQFVLDNSDCDVLLWDSVVNQSVCHYGLHKYSKFHSIAGTNSYALRGSYLKHKTEASMTKHGAVIEQAKKLKANIKDLRQTHEMSCYNWHPGSMSAINAFRDYLDFPKLFPRNKPLSLPSHWQWLEPWYGQVIDLVQCLRPSNVHLQK